MESAFLKRNELMITKLDSSVISALRFPLIIGVVCIHSRYGGGQFTKFVRWYMW